MKLVIGEYMLVEVFGKFDEVYNLPTRIKSISPSGRVVMTYDDVKYANPHPDKYGCKHLYQKTTGIFNSRYGKLRKAPDSYKGDLNDYLTAQGLYKRYNEHVNSGTCAFVDGIYARELFYHRRYEDIKILLDKLDEIRKMYTEIQIAKQELSHGL